METVPPQRPPEEEVWVDTLRNGSSPSPAARGLLCGLTAQDPDAKMEICISGECPGERYLSGCGVAVTGS